MDNPMAAIKAPKADTPPTMPFEDAEVDRVIAAARGFTIQGSYGKVSLPYPASTQI